MLLLRQNRLPGVSSAILLHCCSNKPYTVVNIDVLLQEEGMDEGIGEMRFKLPASASPGAMLFLLAGCREVARAGGHSVGTAAVRLLQWHLSHAVLQAFRFACFACFAPLLLPSLSAVNCGMSAMPFLKLSCLLIAASCSHTSCLSVVEASQPRCAKLSGLSA